MRLCSIRAALLGGSILATVCPLWAAEVTPDRLVNADKEPQNWLMNHRTYDGQRFSPLARINKDTVKNLKLAYAVALGGSAGDEWTEATPLVENGFIYVTDSWGVLYKIDGTAGDRGRIVWRMEPKQEKQANNRGAALSGNLIISPANWPGRLLATDKETGKVVWETNMVFGQDETRITAEDHRRSLGRGQRRPRLGCRARCRDR
jgi:alcohol dehydrogenase (cytochrome c)